MSHPDWIVSDLARKLGCVKSWALVKKGGLKQEDFTEKEGSQLLFKKLSQTAAGSCCSPVG